MSLDVTIKHVVSLDAETRTFLGDVLNRPPASSFDFEAAFAAMGASLSKFSDALINLKAEVADAKAAAKAHLDAMEAKAQADSAHLADLEKQLADAKAAIDLDATEDEADMAIIADLESQIKALKDMLAVTDPTNPAVIPPGGVDNPPAEPPADAGGGPV